MIHHHGKPCRAAGVVVGTAIVHDRNSMVPNTEGRYRQIRLACTQGDHSKDRCAIHECH